MATRSKSEYEFSLVLDGIDEIDDVIVGKFIAAGGEDGYLARISGVVTASFFLSAPSFADAVLKAIQIIEKAAVGVTGFRLDSRDMVSLSDVGRRIGKTKQAISNYATGRRGPGGFPAPAIDAKDPLYAWAEVASWLESNRLLPKKTAEEAKARRVVHAALEYGRAARESPNVVRKLARAIRLPV